MSAVVVLGSHHPGVEGMRSCLGGTGCLEDIDLREASFTTVGYGAAREDKTRDRTR